MADVPRNDDHRRSLPRHPWMLLISANVLAFAACALSQRGTTNPPALYLIPLFLSGLMAIAAVQFRLRTATWFWSDRVESAAIVSVAGLVGIAGFLSMHADWLSGKMFFGAVFIASLIGSALVLLPPLARRFAISLLLLFHFGGMAVCVTSVDPPGGQGPWVAKQLWNYVYRPYLSFMYLTNAYHFYSPDPAPPSMLWFAVHFDDGTYSWVKLPERSNSPITMHYQRMLALPEHSWTAMNRLPLTAAELRILTPGRLPPRGTWEDIFQRRQIASSYEYIDPHSGKPYPIPMITDLDVTVLYREPTEVSKKLIASVARRILWTTTPPREGVKAKTVKVYRITQQILSPAEISEGFSPWAKEKHWPYFLGEFDQFGNMPQGKELDPFLYWYLPILRVPASYPNHGVPLPSGVPGVATRALIPKDNILLDCLELHASGRIRGVGEKKQ